MLFYSTNGTARPASLEQAVMTGLAPDGGLYMPQTIPVIPRAFFNNISDMSISDISYVVADILLGDDIPSGDLREIVSDTFSFDIPLTPLSDNIYSLELFHGPTLAFKDVGARFLARLIAYFNRRRSNKEINVLVATSGDSGGAVAAGFHNVAGVKVYVLYPKGTLSEMQEKQFTTLGGNIYPIEVSGTFDDCQAMVKEAFTDPELRDKLPLTSANSINIGRLLPQMFYYFHAYSRLIHSVHDPINRPDVVISVPCGNLGNLTAGLMAKRMGLPVSRFIAANNRNDTFVRFLRDGRLEARKSVRTLANAMDVGNPSNIRRIIDIYRGDIDALLRDIEGRAYSDSEIAETMSTIYRTCSYLLDPHGASACRALSEALRPGEKGIFLETAHPSKFPSRVNRILGTTLRNPADRLIPLNGVTRQKISPHYPALKNYLLSSTN